MLKLKNFLENIYENINIYHSLIVIDDNYPDNSLNMMFSELQPYDFSLMYMDNFNNLKISEYYYRIFIIRLSNFVNYIDHKDQDISNINLILAFNDLVYKKIVQYLKSSKNVNIAEKLYIFSCNN